MTLLAAIGAGAEPGTNAVLLLPALDVLAREVKRIHPGVSVAAVYGQVIDAIVGRGEHAALWLLLRGRAPAPAEIVEVTV